MAFPVSLPVLTGAPQMAMIASPMYFVHDAPGDIDAIDHPGHVVVEELDHFLRGQLLGYWAVKLRMSEKKTATSFRSPPSCTSPRSTPVRDLLVNELAERLLHLLALLEPVGPFR